MSRRALGSAIPAAGHPRGGGRLGGCRPSQAPARRLATPPEGTQYQTRSCLKTEREGQREKANTRLKTSASISEHYLTPLLANCTNPSVRRPLLLFAHANCFQFSLKTAFALANVCAYFFFRLTPASMICVILVLVPSK